MEDIVAVHCVVGHILCLRHAAWEAHNANFTQNGLQCRPVSFSINHALQAHLCYDMVQQVWQSCSA